MRSDKNRKRTHIFQQLRSTRAQIVLAFSALILAVGITEMFAYKQVNRLHERELKRNFRALQMESKALVNSTREFLMVDQFEDAFYLEDSSALLNQYETAKAGFWETSQATRLALGEQGYTELAELDHLDASVQDLDTLFKTLVTKVRDRGNLDYGLISEFDQGLMFMSQFDFGADESTLLGLQIETKNYQLTGEQYIVDFIRSELSGFEEICVARLTADQHQMVGSVLFEYASTLDRLVSLDQELGTFTGAGMRGAVSTQLATIEQQADMQQTLNLIDNTYEEIVNGVIYCLLLILLITVVIAVVITVALFRNLVRPISRLQSLIHRMSRGVLPDEIPTYRNIEVREIAGSVDILARGMRRTSEFASQIGDGNFESEYESLGEHDLLGNSLLHMRKNLKSLSEEETKRNWGNEGYSNFMEILRSNSARFTDLGTGLLPELIRFLGANQGSIYALNEQNPDDLYMEMVGCYAWSRAKNQRDEVRLNEGLVGQAWQDQERIYVTDVPDDYILITSGLGDANPRSILVQPLVQNDLVIGILELASLREFAPHELEFIERVAESIAAAMLTVRVNERTSRLVDELQEKSESLRTQEEELRQNMEEMMASNEEYQRREVAYLEQIEQLKLDLGVAEVQQN